MCVVLLIVGLTLGVIGISVWGLVEGLKKTDGRVSTFWNLVGDGRTQVLSVSTDANLVVGNITAVASTLSIISNVLSLTPGIRPALTAYGIDADQLQAEVNSANAGLSTVIASGRDVAASVQTQGLSVFNEITKAQPESEKINGKYRIAALVVLFGLYAVIAIFVGGLGALGRTPRTTSAFLLLFWLLTGFILVLGAGIGLGAYHISKDTCLYAESYILRLASEKAGPTSTAQLAIRYYLGATSIPDSGVLQQVYGVNTTQLAVYRSQPQTASLLRALDSPTGDLALRTSVPPISESDRLTIEALPELLNTTASSIGTLQDALNRDSFYPLYVRAKGLICCDLTSIIFTLWLTWTIAGGIGGALAATVSGTTFASIVPEDFSKEDLDATGRVPAQYNHPIHGYNQVPARQSGSPHPQGAVYADRVRDKQYSAL